VSGKRKCIPPIAPIPYYQSSMPSPWNTRTRSRVNEALPQPSRHPPWLVLGFLGALIAIQATAMATQFRRGFVPFKAVPTRVPFSWDMFSIPIQRCGIEWQPALPIGNGSVPSLRSLAPALEWDPVYNLIADYLAVARFSCVFRKAPTRVRMACMTGHRAFDYAFDCP
jgi:hypothetical protein